MENKRPDSSLSWLPDVAYMSLRSYLLILKTLQKEEWDCSAVGKDDKGYQDDPFSLIWAIKSYTYRSSSVLLTTVPPRTDSLVVSTKTKAGLVTEDDPTAILSHSLTVWRDTIAVFSDVDMVLRAVVIAICMDCQCEEQHWEPPCLELFSASSWTELGVGVDCSSSVDMPQALPLSGGPKIELVHDHQAQELIQWQTAVPVLLHRQTQKVFCPSGHKTVQLLSVQQMKNSDTLSFRSLRRTHPHLCPHSLLNALYLAPAIFSIALSMWLTSIIFSICTANGILLETAQEIQPATDPEDPVLHSDLRVHSHSLHNYLVWFLHLTRKNQTPALTAERIIGCNLPSLQQIYTSRVRKRAGKITSDPSHPGHLLFQTLPSGRRLRSIKTSTTRHANSFFPRAVALLNHSGHLHLFHFLARTDASSLQVMPVNMSLSRNETLFWSHEQAETNHTAKEHLGPEVVLVPVIFGCIFFLGIVGNALVMVVIGRIKSGRSRSTTNIFILNLSIADLSFLLFCVPFQATIYSLPEWIFGAFLCKSVHYFVTVTMLVSIFTLVAMSVDRYVAVVLSKKSPCIRNRRNALLGVWLIWLLSLIFAVPVAQHQVVTDHPDAPNSSFCWEIWGERVARQTYKVTILVIGYLLPLVLITCCYAKVLYHLHKKIKNMSKKSERSKRKDPIFPREDELCARSARMNSWMRKDESVFAICSPGEFVVKDTASPKTAMESDCHGVTQNGSGSSSVASPAVVSVETTNESSRLKVSLCSTAFQRIQVNPNEQAEVDSGKEKLPQSLNRSNKYLNGRYDSSERSLRSQVFELSPASPAPFEEFSEAVKAYHLRDVVDMDGLYKGCHYGHDSQFSRETAQQNCRSEKPQLRTTTEQTAQTVLLVVAAFLLCWMPHHIIAMWVEFGSFPLNDASFAFRIASHCLAYGNSCVNPILYAFLSENFRKACRQVFTCHLFYPPPPVKKIARIRMENFSTTHSTTNV
ncbi:hypothetical protein NFI96_011095 [Prochilodus magdalenae]|nr:hypothetical protein NFI96_011095 [Prochilodus magdalenae]